nr:putative B3 domain-containing protein At3g24850 [Ipomoea batatas]
MVRPKSVKHNTLPISSYKFEPGASSSGDAGEAAPEQNPSPNWKWKRSNKRKRNSQEPPPGLPAKIKKLLLYLPETRSVSDAKLAIQKQLTDTDTSGHHNRLSIPGKHLQETFLTEEEELLLCTRNENNNVGSMDVPLITPMMEVAWVSLRRWEMKKTKGASSVTYVLTTTWNKIREQSKLRSGMIVQLWAIRIDGHLCFALASLP